MFTIWMDALDDAGLGLPAETEDQLRTDVTVGPVDGGYYSPAGSVRATIDLLMNSNIPVLGTVNRNWAEDVLAHYTADQHRT